MIAVQEAASDPHVHRITVMCGAQTGKTDTTMNIIGHMLDDNPAPILYVGPTRSQVEKVAEPRLMAMIRSAPDLKKQYAKGKSSSKTAKRVNGVQCRLAWAGSASELASQEAKLAIMDEVDRMDLDVKGEGSPIELVEARLATFPGSKLILTSTPTEGNVVEEANDETGFVHWALGKPEDIKSTVWRFWQEGTRQEWAWPCPECDEYFIPRLKLLKWPEDATPAVARRETRMVCPHCACLIDDSSKEQMNTRGRFVAPGQRVSTKGVVTPPLEFNEHRSFWISGLASPWKSWGHRAAAFITVARSGDPARVQGVLNTAFGELFRTGGSAPPWQDVRDLGAGYLVGEFPVGPLALTCGVDVQKDRLVYVVRGWAYQLESWLIEHGEIYGPTDEDQTWTNLSALLDKTWGELPIRLMVIDSGYRPGDKWRRPDHMVYKFCRQYPGRAVPTKGKDEQSKPLYAAQIDVKVNGQLIKKGLQLWHVDSNYMKSWVHSRLELPVGQPGTWHLPSDVSDDYCQQITAEAKSIKASGHAVWLVIRKENHVLDCEALNVAAAHMLSLQTVRPPAEADEKASVPMSPPAHVVSAARQVQAKTFYPRRNFATGWRG